MPKLIILSVCTVLVWCLKIHAALQVENRRPVRISSSLCSNCPAGDTEPAVYGDGMDAN